MLNLSNDTCIYTDLYRIIRKNRGEYSITPPDKVFLSICFPSHISPTIPQKHIHTCECTRSVVRCGNPTRGSPLLTVAGNQDQSNRKLPFPSAHHGHSHVISHADCLNLGPITFMWSLHEDYMRVATMSCRNPCRVLASNWSEGAFSGVKLSTTLHRLMLSLKM